ncbi:MAG: T9SS type A sorting domain-containing protein [Bacteroidales bacterium]|nr:T9SS type A sorting domain-containing protein [Bacteroidales bacterium]
MLLPLAAKGQEVLIPAASGGKTSAVAAKSPAAAVRLPFFDDFSNYEGRPRASHWAQGGATVGAGYAQHPPTVGMMSLDALDAEGHLYPQASTSTFAADTATSARIMLSGLTAADSVVLSFYYLPGGGSGNLWERVGDTPGSGDSLFLDFYLGAEHRWQTVWRRGGCSADSLLVQTGRDWQYVSIPLTEAVYFDSLFRFRFRNYCSLEDNGKTGFAGNCDQWNIDYVLLDRGRSSAATPEFRDVAFVCQAPSMLAHYRAMPAWQFRPSEMDTTLNLTITNLYSLPFTSHYTYTILDEQGNSLHAYDGGYENIAPFLPSGAYQDVPTHARPSVNFSFPLSRQQCSYTAVHVVREGSAGDDRPANDTIRYAQQFADYYAYDDGSAENGYGLTSTADSVYLAYRFDLNERDTLSAIDLYFNQAYDGSNLQVKFLLTVWKAEGGKPGRVLYRDRTSRHAEALGFNHFVLEHIVEVEGSIFVGFTQIGNNYINIGFDRSFNTADRIYYLTAVDWQQSILSGSLMLRPRFTRPGSEGIATARQSSSKLTLFPNPATDVVYVSCDAGSILLLLDGRGKTVKQVRSESEQVLLRTEGLPSGIYIVKVSTPSGTASAPLIIAH